MVLIGRLALASSVQVVRVPLLGAGCRVRLGRLRFPTGVVRLLAGLAQRFLHPCEAALHFVWFCVERDRTFWGHQVRHQATALTERSEFVGFGVSKVAVKREVDPGEVSTSPDCDLWGLGDLRWRHVRSLAVPVGSCC